MSKTKVQYLNALVEYCKEENALKESIKAVKDAAKEDGFDPSILAAVAKAIANATETDLIDKSKALIDTVQAYTG
jgi:formaldehyde-activating enzyme involved in methanogenesis